jgi:hypothetical protein
MRVVGRLILVPLAGLVGGLFALLVAGLLGLERTTAGLHGRDSDEVIGAGFALMDALVRLSASFSIVPPLLVIIVGEVARIRSALYYVLGGGAALAVPAALTQWRDMLHKPDLDAALVEPVLWQVMATAGFAGGLVYWLLAGRRA